MKKKTQEEFINEAKEVHGEKYDYSKVEYNGFHEKVCIICPEHGEFWQSPNAHLHGQGCKICSGKKLNREIFIKRAKEIHENKYDYSKVKYKDNKTKVCIICHEKDKNGKEHGEFWQSPNKHLLGSNCPKCVSQYIPTTEEFIERAKLVHGDKYDYSKTEYMNIRSKIKVICKKHGEFDILPQNHLNGCGCPKCKMSKLETIIGIFLIKENISFDFNKKFDWLKNKKPLSLDFYLPDYNVAIECQGEQHLIKERKFKNKSQIENDLIKNKLCKEHNVKILYFSEILFEKIEINNEIYTHNNFFINKYNLLNSIRPLYNNK